MLTEEQLDSAVKNILWDCYYGHGLWPSSSFRRWFPGIDPEDKERLYGKLRKFGDLKESYCCPDDEWLNFYIGDSGYMYCNYELKLRKKKDDQVKAIMILSFFVFFAMAILYAWIKNN